MVGVFIGDPVMAAPAGVLRNREGEIVVRCGESCTRAAVAREMALQLRAGKATPYGGLLLDFGPNLETSRGSGFGNAPKTGQLDAARLAYGEEAYLWHEPWDVAPTAHYNMGGIRSDGAGRSPRSRPVRGRTGDGRHLRGRPSGLRFPCRDLRFRENRRARSGAEAATLPPGPEPDHRSAAWISCLSRQEGTHTPGGPETRLQQTMWEKAGIARDELSLLSALEEIQAIRAEAGDIVTSS
jgi:succinate dehydrogenase/fumarate reductase flavoprotein subunit